MLAAGDLRSRVTLQQQSGAQDSSGQPLDDWQDVLPTLWARVVAASAKTQQVNTQDGSVANVTHVVTIRYPRTIVPRSNMRVLLDGRRVLQVMAVPGDPDGRRESFDLLCQEQDEGVA